MNGQERTVLEDLCDEVREHRKENKSHGEILTRLDERTLNQKDRLDRIEKKSAAWGAVTGAVAAAGVVIAKAFGFDSQP